MSHRIDRRGDLPEQHVRVAVIGAGFGGLGAAIRLREAGIARVVVLERADRLGGTWRENTYPGCACDVPSHLYSFSFHLNPDWSRMFAPQGEILDYLHSCAREHGVDEIIRFGTDVRSAHWNDGAGHWELETSRGPLTAQFIVSASGPLSEPARPNVPGLDSFSGTMFHSAQWRHDHDLRDRRVAVIGTGASAAQFIPAIAAEAGRLDVYQRTPGWVVPRPDFSHGTLQRRLFRRLPGLQRLLRLSIYYLAESLLLGLVYDKRLLAIPEAVARLHLRRQVRNPSLRAKLQPNYRIGCKRIILSSDYLRSLDQAHVDVVTEGIREIVADGIVTVDGVHRRYDTIILGTGFRIFAVPLTERVIGRDGHSLAEEWRGSPQAYVGTVVAGFPNHFLVIGPNTGLGNNSMINIIEAQLVYIIDAIKAAERAGARSIDVRREVQDRYNASIQSRLAGTVWVDGGCNSWYLDQQGINRTLWPTFSDRFKRELRGFDLADFHVQKSVEHEAPVPA
jgi:cation diffusion facilitator CzcD-associated flavoprotein CzcO